MKLCASDPVIAAALRDYVSKLYHDDTILFYLKTQYGVSTNLSALRRAFVSLGLFRHDDGIDDEAVDIAVRNAMTGPGRLIGIKSMHRRVRISYGLFVRRQQVYDAMKRIDPMGLELRRSRRIERRVFGSPGPNHCWSMDGYDKLNPILPIHACLDAFSRKCLWLQVIPSNKSPHHITELFLKQVESLAACPSLLRCDLGSENVHAAVCQIAFRSIYTDAQSGVTSVAYGSSTHNIVSEQFWSQLRSRVTDTWIAYYRHLKDEDRLNIDDAYHRKIAIYCFKDLLQSDLDKFMIEHNSHRIRKQRRLGRPSGCVIDELYDRPEKFNATDFRKAVCSAAVAAARLKYPVPCYPMDELTALLHRLRYDYLGRDLISHDNVIPLYLYMISNYHRARQFII